MTGDTTEQTVAEELRRLLAEQVALAAIDAGDLEEGATDIVIAALEGEEALAAAVGGVSVDRPTRTGDHGAVPVAKVAYLQALEVEGFRGIGRRVPLVLDPKPGLTVITGRNGSGKSSLVEAMELAFTGQTYRYAGRTSQRLEAWRNIHHTGRAGVRVRLAVRGEGITDVGLNWDSGAGREDFTQWAQRPGDKRVEGTDPLGWKIPIEMYRPILTYDEIGHVFDGKRSALYDALNRILGLGDLTDAVTRIRAVHTAKATLRKTADALKKDLARDLKSVTDERAVAALKELRRRPPDVAAVAALATGDTGRSAVTSLRELASASVPDAIAIDAVFSELSGAQADFAAAAVADSARVRARLDILRAAFDYRGAGARAADGASVPCMVCGTGILDDAWAERVRVELREAPTRDELDRANARLRSATEAAESLVRGMLTFAEHPALTYIETRRADAISAAATYREVAGRHPEGVTDPAARASAHTLATCLAEVAAVAAVEASARADVWAPFAVRLADWVVAEERAAPFDTVVKRVEAAADWLDQKAAAMRAERIARVESEARDIWSSLRQESNVDLQAVRLEGAAKSTQRHVRMEAAIDGEETTLRSR
ncbi:ATP-binding protein [Tsukamurella soli]|uniref:ATP-binding protein n=1 Tax=Tsukamurella soli TaxID=644556 RepID=UPI00361121FA